jgi:hypothetical protein
VLDLRDNVIGAEAVGPLANALKNNTQVRRCTHSASLSHTLSHTHSLSYTLSYTHSLIHSLIHTLSHTQLVHLDLWGNDLENRTTGELTAPSVASAFHLYSVASVLDLRLYTDFISFHQVLWE